MIGGAVCYGHGLASLGRLRLHSCIFADALVPNSDGNEASFYWKSELISQGHPTR